MPCYVCNPSCGKCRPPRPLQLATCPECGKASVRLPDTSGICRCKHCSAVLPNPQPIFCQYTQCRCLVPCVRQAEVPSSGLAEPCPWGNALDEATPSPELQGV